MNNIALTILFIFIGVSAQKSLFRFDELRSFTFSSRHRGSIRIRAWDENYLTSLIYQYPQVGYKYFSDEGRSLLKFRKTPEEFNRENLQLLERERKLTKELEDEKNKRITAERDAIWKDISFSAAHKMGNPIFAIETILDPLQRRIKTGKNADAIEIIGRIRTSVEKAKGIVDQFKSLTKAQKINPEPILIYPILEEMCQELRNCGIDCKIKSLKKLKIYADPERINECFDELVTNVTHSFENGKALKSVRIEAKIHSDSLPDYLDSTKTYVLIHFKDNGIGIPVENKDKIFDAFFTTREHGTGLGLALVRRIIEGHGGAIREVGFPEKGADFEIYLPIPPGDGSNDEAK